MNLKFVDSLLDLIFPRFCVNCGKLHFFLCPNCYEQIEFLTLPLKITLEPNYLDQIWAISNYQPPMNNLIKAFKYQSVKKIGQFLGKMLFQTTDLPQVDLITWVPLHPKKQSQRGFNQTQEIALALAQAWKCPTKPLLTRVKHLPPQASLKNKTQRLARMKNIFQFNQKNTQFCQNKSILLIDDVITTGATLNTCAQILKQAEAKKVIGLAVSHEA